LVLGDILLFIDDCNCILPASSALSLSDSNICGHATALNGCPMAHFFLRYRLNIEIARGLHATLMWLDVTLMWLAGLLGGSYVTLM
jgi:hypothetical protein